ncbi:MAG: hypothetical protein PHD48_03685 [Alphaproteobacteria bacterium]|nr:hypothetical protein [Alphaproteobacteria bacterium]
MLDKTKHNMRCTAQTLMIILMATAYAFPANADHLETLHGVAVVEDMGTLAINGTRVSLWGMDMLAPDQQCWQNDEAWPCGEEALMALKHFAGGRIVECEMQTAPDKDGPALAKCYRWKRTRKIDIAEHMIAEGWALERGATSGGIYYWAEQSAQTNKEGAWSGRFQTAQDWRDGIQRFVGEDDPDQQPESDSPQE